MPNPSQRRPRGRPSRYAKYDELLASLPPVMTKRPLYCDQIGLFNGSRGTTVWVKVGMPGGQPAKEIKLGSLKSWSWEGLEAKRDELQGRADRGEPLVEVPTATFSDRADDWLARRKATAKGFDILQGHVANHLKPSFGKKPLAAISVADVNSWIATQRRSLKPSTVQRQLSTLNAILNDAVRSELISRNPAKMADPIRGVAHRDRFLPPAELEKVLQTADAIEAQEVREAEVKPHQKRGWLRHFVLLALHSGMRRQELLNLRWSNILQLEDDVRLIRIETSKNDQPRLITCNEDMKVILDGLKELDRAKGDDRLFPVSLTTLKRKLTKLWKATGLNDVRLHDLRRTHASVLVRAGVDMRTVAGRMGHRDTKMLEQVYAVFLGDDQATLAAQTAFASLSQKS